MSYINCTEELKSKKSKCKKINRRSKLYFLNLINLKKRFTISDSGSWNPSILCSSSAEGGFTGCPGGKESICQCMQKTWVRSLGQEESLEKEMATHSRILAWEIPGTEEPGRLQSIGLQKSQTRLSY